MQHQIMAGVRARPATQALLPRRPACRLVCHAVGRRGLTVAASADGPPSPVTAQPVAGAGPTSAGPAVAAAAPAAAAAPSAAPQPPSAPAAAASSQPEPSPEPEKPQRAEDEVPQVDKEWVKEVWAEVTDKSKFGTRGEGWFLAQVLMVLLVVFPPTGIKGFLDTIGWLVVVGGLGMMLAGQKVLGKNLTPLPKPRDNNMLVTTGIFNLCRHPMYGGLMLVAAGLTLATGNEVRLVMSLIAFFVLNEKASYEERFLVERYPEEYPEYQKRTKKLIPYIF